MNGASLSWTCAAAAGRGVLELVSRTRELEALTLPALIPPGEYTVRTARLARRRFFGRPVVIIHCEVRGGEHDGLVVPWFATALPRRGLVPASSKLFRALVLVLGRRPGRGERLSEDVLVEKLLRARIDTVTRGADGQPLPEGARYSVVNRFLERLA